MGFSEWSEVKLGDVCLLGDGAHTKVKRIELGVPYLTSKNIKNGYIDLEKVDYICEDDYYRLFGESQKSVRHLQQGDLLIGIIGTLGNCYLYKTEDYFGISSSIGIIRPNKELLYPPYLYHFVSSKRFMKLIQNFKGGSVQAYTNLPTLRNVPITLPSIVEQKAIAHILSTLDEKIEVNNRINKTLETMAQEIFKRWFMDFEFPNENGDPYKSSGGEMVESEMGMIPKGWEIGHFMEYVSVLSGGTPKTTESEYWNGEIPFFTPKDCKSLYCIDTEKNITENGLNRCNSQLYDINTVFITARGTVGKVALAGSKMAMNQSCYALIGINNVNQYATYFFTKQAVEQLRSNASGSVFDAIIVDTFKPIKLVRPINNQLDRFENIVRSMFDKILTNHLENKKMQETRDTLLPKIMSGEIRIPIIGTEVQE